MPSYIYKLDITSRVAQARAIGITADQGEITAVSISPAQPGRCFIRRFGRWAAILLYDPVPRDPNHPLAVTVETDRPAVVTGGAISDGGMHPLGQPPLIHWQTLQAVEENSRLAAPPALQKAAEYFAQLDAATHPLLLRERWGNPRYAQGITCLVTEVGNALVEKLVSRYSNTPPPPPPTSASLALFSRLQRDLLAANFGPHTLPAFAPAVMNAYTQFGAGDLFMNIIEQGLAARERLSNAGPNSANVFLFCEFAFAAHDAGIDADLWLAMLPSMTACAELYLVCYGVYNGTVLSKQPLASYGDQPKRTAPPAIRDQVIRDCAGLTRVTAETRIATLARSAFTPAPHPTLALAAHPQIVHDLSAESFISSHTYPLLPAATGLALPP